MAQHRHKRDANARRLNPFRARATVVAGPLAVLATASAVSLGVLSADVTSLPASISAAPTAGERAEEALDLAGDAGRSQQVSRGGDREVRAAKVVKRDKPRKDVRPAKVERLLDAEAKREAIRAADTKLWATADLNLWTEPGDQARQTGLLPAGARILVTGRSMYGREEVVWGKKQTRWVTAGYLSAEEPMALGGECTNGTSVPSGVSENVVAVHQAVCAEFPEITSYGTFRSDGEHSQGIAIDIMVSGDRGWEVAEFLREYYADLGISYLIYAQQIWSVERSGEGWRGMEDRGSVTANHYDHVHVTTY